MAENGGEAETMRAERLAALSNGVPAGLIELEATDDGPRALCYSEGFFAFSGLARDELDSRAAADPFFLVLEEDRPALLAAISEACASGAPFSLLYRCRAGDGSARWFELRGSVSRGSGDGALIRAVQLDVAERAREEERARPGEQGPQKLPDKKRRLLIVDDDRMDCELLANIFRNEFRIEKAGDGAAALMRLRHYGSAISAVLLDLVMPGMDGFAVLEKMRGNTEMRTIPVVVVSAVDDRESTLRAIRCGAADYVTKPVDADLISLRVHSAVSKAENERLRAQNELLLLQNEEISKYRTVLESTGTIVVVHDWIKGVFNYDPLMSRYLAGTYDSRSLWHILLSDMVADVMDVRKMQNMTHDIAGNKLRSGASMMVLLKSPTGAKHWFRMKVIRQKDDFALTDKLFLTFNDIGEAL